MSQTVQELLAWAETHSPRTRRLRSLINDLIGAGMADRQITESMRKVCDEMQADRDAIAEIAFEFAKCVYYNEVDLTDDQYRLYTSALINQKFAPLVGKEKDPEKFKELAEDAFYEVSELGCPESLVEDMRTNFLRSFVTQEKEEKEDTEPHASDADIEACLRVHEERGE